MKRTQNSKKLQKAKPKAKPKTTALAVRPKLTVVPMSPPSTSDLIGVLGEQAQLGALGLAELKLTAAEESVLAKPVDRANVLILPTGQVYLPHISYTRWMNEAFGRTGWSLVPVAKPSKADRSVVCPYVLRIHGIPVAFAYGEQEYFDGSGGQSYGDALEATHASALRRCTKRLGMALELWDKAWGDAFVHEHGIRVKVAKKWQGQTKVSYQWRLKTGTPFYNEIGGTPVTPEGEMVEEDWRQAPAEPAQRRAAPPPERTSSQAGVSEPPASHSGWQAQPISEKQFKRLVMIIKNSGRDVEATKAWVKRYYGVAHGNELKRGDYQSCCEMIEAQENHLPERR